MQTIVAGLMALTAMGASILSSVDPVTVVTRGGIAFVAGLVLSGIWVSVVCPGKPKEKAKKAPKAKPAVVESEPEAVVEDEPQEEAA